MLTQRYRIFLAAIFAFLAQYALSQPTLDSQVLSEQGSRIEAGPIELLSVGGQAIIADTSQDVLNLQLGYLQSLTLVSKPLAAITSPTGDDLCAIVNGDITVTGTVESVNLSGFRLEFAPGLNASTGYVLLSSGTAPASGVLAVWPTAGLTGFHTLRLSATDTSGGSMFSMVSVFVGQPSVALTVDGLDKPDGTATGPDDKLYVADTHNDRIVVLTSTGGALASFGGFHKPSGVAVDGGGNIYVADTQNDRVLKLGTDGSVLLAFGAPDKKKGPFKKPQSVTMDPGGLIYVADTGNHSIKAFNTVGAPAMTITLPDEGKPVAVTVDSSGRIYVADEKRGRILQYDHSGLLLKIFGLGTLKEPGGVAVNGDCIFVADTGHDRIVRFDSLGNIQASFTGFDKPAGLALTTSGNLLIADRHNDRLIKLSPPTTSPTILVGQRKGHGRAEAKLSRNQGGTVEQEDGTGVRIPAAAMAVDLNISVERADETRDADAKQAKRQKMKIESVSAEIEYGPAGTVFNTPVTLVLAYDSSQVAARGINENDLKVYYWNKSLGDWEPLPSIVDKQSKTVSALTSHFSGYQVQGPGAGIGVAAATDEFYLREAYAFPNPVRGASAVTLRIQPGLADTIEVRVYDLAGRRIHSSSDFRFSVTGGENTYDHSWNVSGVGSGVYAFIIRARKAGQADIVKAGKIGVIK